MTDPVSDMLTRIRNASGALKPEVRVSFSKLKGSIAKILEQEGYIGACSVESEGVRRELCMKLKYTGRQAVIVGLKRVSRPGLRRYVPATGIPRVLGGLGTVIISTPRGVMSGTEARKQNVGGEVLCYVW